MKQLLIWLAYARIEIQIIFNLLLFNALPRHIDLVSRLSVLAAFSCLVVAIFLFNKMTDRDEDSADGRQRAMALPNTKHSTNVLKLRLAILIVAPLFLLCYNVDLVLIYCAVLALGFWYSSPIKTFHLPRLKSIFLVKNAAAALGATIPIATIPFVLSGHFNKLFPVLFLLYFLVFLSTEIFADIRDTNGDRLCNIPTIPVRWGVRSAKIVLTAILFAIACLLHSLGVPASKFLLLGNFLIFVIFANENRSVLYFSIPGQIWAAFVLYEIIRPVFIPS